jgi:PTH1 family peptidyl-tRNA hydrolase
MCLNRFARKHSIELNHRQCQSRVGKGLVAGVEVILARPQTYMNASGEAVAALLDRYRVSVDDLLVVHDDLDLPLGRIRLRASGSSGGHKGLKSIIAALGGNKFARLKVGIGRPDRESGNEAVVGYVLGDFSVGETKLADEMISRAVEAIDCFVSSGTDATMNRFNAPADEAGKS